MRQLHVIPSLAAAAALAGLGYAASADLRAQAQIPKTDLLVQTRSMEQPQPSAYPVKLPEGNPFEMLPVLGGVYLLAGGPSNVAIQVGNEGVLLVDSATADLSDMVLQAIRVVSNKPVAYIINTSPDPLHFGGNEKIGNAGQNPTQAPAGIGGPGAARPDNNGGGGNNPAALRPMGAIVFAHENTLNRLSAPTGEKSDVPFGLWPTNTFFTERKSLYFNDEPIELLHAPNAHTDGDVMVFFRKSDVIATGDVIDTLGYPMFDATKGGGITGELDALNTVIDVAVPHFNQQGGTRIVPGHGRILNEADVVEYRDMVTIIHDRVKLGIEKGLSLAQIKAQRPTFDYDGLYSRPTWTGEMFVDAIYADLTRASAGASTRN
jgi:glyoxylase-like metal-dependent hydrolase (beta-lactamase superfamily II)